MSAAHELGAAMDGLRQRLLAGALVNLDTLADEIGQSLEALEGAPADPEELAALQLRAIELAQLLDSAARGLAAARRRVSEIEAVRQGQGTYGDDGRRQTLYGTGAFNRKA